MNEKQKNREMLMILDGLYGAVEQVIIELPKGSLKNNLGFQVLRPLKNIIKTYCIDDTFFNKFRGSAVYCNGKEERMKICC